MPKGRKFVFVDGVLVLCRRSCRENLSVLMMFRLMICNGYFLAKRVRVRWYSSFCSCVSSLIMRL